MSELTAADLAAYTGGRLDPADPATQRWLDIALEAARRYCGWHVAPNRTDTLTLDGPGAALLVLPTLNMTDLGAVTEGGSVHNLADLVWPTRGLVRKRGGTDTYWNGCPAGHWTALYGGLEVTLTHGFDDAAWWQSAVLGYADRTSLALGGGGGQRTAVGPFQYATTTMAAASTFTAEEQAVLDKYKLEWMP